MEAVRAFIPLVVLWLGSAALLALPQLGLAAYRKRRVPDLGALWALAGGSAAVWVVANEPFSPVLGGIILFLGGYGGFMAVGFASFELKSARTSQS